MEQAKPANKKALWYVVVGVVLVALIVIFAVVYGNSNQPVAGSKTITVQIVNGDSTETNTCAARSSRKTSLKARNPNTASTC